MSCHTDQHDAGEPGAAAGTSGDASNGCGSPRRGDAQRSTAETKIEASVCLDGTGRADVSTGLKFLDHMITSLAKHSMLDITLRAESVDGIMHHLAEDTAIVLGSAIDGALDARSGIARFGHASVPLDESLAEATIDLVRRPYARVRLLLGPRGESPAIEDMAKEDVEHFFQSLLENMASCTHLEVRYGQNDHHKAEAAIKAVAVALRQAVATDAARAGGAPSTKGSM